MNDAPIYNSDTVKSVLTILQKEYDNENNRIKFITSKVQMMLTISSILITAIFFIIQAISKNKAYLSKVAMTNACAQLWTTRSLFFAVFMILFAILLFLYILITKTFARIKFEAIVFDRELIKDTCEVESRLITTYEEALKSNIPVGDTMALFFKRGTIIVAVAIGILITVLIKAMP